MEQKPETPQMELPLTTDDKTAEREKALKEQQRLRMVQQQQQFQGRH